MARFVSRHPGYSHGVRSEVAEVFAQGKRVIVTGLEAQFERRGVTAYEKEIGGKLLLFPGLPEDKETGANVPTDSRIGLFDSELAKRTLRWTDEDHDLVVETLRLSEMNGVQFIEVEAAKRPAPWNGYDKLENVDEIVELALATETSLNDVAAYELENRNREELLKLLADLADDLAPAEVVIEA